MEGIHLSKQLATESNKFHLGCITDKNYNIVKDMVWIEFTEIEDKQYSSQNLIWDNSSYIFFEFYNYLKHRLDNSVTKQELEEFADISEYLDSDENSTQDLLNLLNTAKELNWN